MKTEPIRVLLADDDKFVREGLRIWLRHSERVKIVGEAENGNKAISLASELRPDVVLMDIRMPTLDGCAAAGRIRHALPGVKVLFFSAYDDRQTVSLARQAGGQGHVTKGCRPQDLVRAIETVHAGRTFFQADGGETPRRGAEVPGTGKLPTRQHQVLVWIAHGFASKQIAEKLSISPRTVEAHRHALMQHFGVHSAAELVHKAAQLNLDLDCLP